MEIDAWSNNKKTCCWETESSPINAGGKGDDYLSYQSARRSCLSRKSFLAAICWTSFRRSINHRQEISGLGRNYHFILTCFGLGSRDRSFSDYPLPYFICINSAACAYSSSTRGDYRFPLKKLPHTCEDIIWRCIIGFFFDNLLRSWTTK